jgi:hypothetical protein
LVNLVKRAIALPDGPHFVTMRLELEKVQTLAAQIGWTAHEAAGRVISPTKSCAARRNP